MQGLAGPEMVAVGVGRLLGKPVALKIVGDNAWEYAIRKGLTDDGIDAFQRQPYGPRLRAVRALVHGYARQVSRLIVPSEYLKGIVRGLGRPPVPGAGDPQRPHHHPHQPGGARPAAHGAARCAGDRGARSWSPRPASTPGRTWTS